MRRTALFVAALGASTAGLALEQAQWPPPPETAQRMHELQHVIIDPSSSAQQRDAARHELADLLKSPAAQARAPDARPPRPARAAIDPFPSVVKPWERVPAAPALPATAPEGVARVEVIQPSKPVIVPQTGRVAAPTGNFLIDSQGNVLHPIPGGGYVDPRTGQIVPR